MKALLFFLLIPGAMAFYMATVAAMGPYQLYPITSYAMIVAGVLGLVWLMVKKRTVWRGVLTVLAVVTGGLFGWWTLDYSNYGGPSEATLAAVGSPLGQTSGGLKDGTGQPFDLAAELASHETTLLVFYRGYW